MKMVHPWYRGWVVVGEGPEGCGAQLGEIWIEEGERSGQGVWIQVLFVLV